MDEYLEVTESIKHKIKDVHWNIWDIGKDLAYAKEKKLYSLHYGTFEGYIKKEFDMSIRHAERFMKITTTFERQAVTDVGIAKLYMLTSVPTEKHIEIIRKIEKRDMNRKELEEEIKRIKDRIGVEPHYSSDPAEHQLKLIRQWNEVQAHLEAFPVAIKQLKEVYEQEEQNLKSDLKSEVANWLEAAKKYVFNEEILERVEKGKKAMEGL